MRMKESRFIICILYDAKITFFVLLRRHALRMFSMDENGERYGTYTFHLKGRLASAVMGGLMALLMALGFGIYLIIIKAYIALIVPAIWAAMGCLFLLLGKKDTKHYITIAPDGVTVFGAKKLVGKEWMDTNETEVFPWTQIKDLEFTRHLGINPYHLYINLLDGERYLFVIVNFNNPHRIIDLLRSYATCRDLSTHPHRIYIW